MDDFHAECTTFPIARGRVYYDEAIDDDDRRGTHFRFRRTGSNVLFNVV